MAVFSETCGKGDVKGHVTNGGGGLIMVTIFEDSDGHITRNVFVLRQGGKTKASSSSNCSESWAPRRKRYSCVRAATRPKWRVLGGTQGTKESEKKSQSIPSCS